MHDEELDTSETTVRALLAAQCPQWSTLPIEYLRTSGTDNAMWRVRVEPGQDVVVRLPRRPHTAHQVEREMTLLRRLAASPLAAIVRTPTVRHIGRAHETFPYRWAVLDWLNGSDAWTERDTLAGHLDVLAVDLANAVLAIGALTDMAVPARTPGTRGGPIAPLVQRLDRWLDDPQWHASERIDAAAVRRLAAQALDVANEPVVSGFVHGDLIAGNVLIERGRLWAIIDWGCAGFGDRAQDLTPAWAILDANSRAIFRRAVGADDASWIRARTFALEQAVGGVLYYVPRRHALGDIMVRTLERILDEQ